MIPISSDKAALLFAVSRGLWPVKLASALVFYLSSASFTAVKLRLTAAAIAAELLSQAQATILSLAMKLVSILIFHSSFRLE